MDGFFVAKLKKVSAKIPERPQRDRRKENTEVVWGEEKWVDSVMDNVCEFENKIVVSNKQKKRAARDERKEHNEAEKEKEKTKLSLKEARAAKRAAKNKEKLKSRRETIKLKEKAKYEDRKAKRKAAREAYERGEGPKPLSKKEVKAAL